MKRKTKQIDKAPKVRNKPKVPKKPLTNEDGQPIIQHLHDFVTSIKTTYTSKPIFTGGRIINTNKHIYSSCNHEISVYSIEQGKVIDFIKHKNEEIANFCICPHEKYLVTFTNNSMIRVFLLESRKLLHSIKVQGLFANCIQFSPNGKHIAFAFGGLVHIYTFETMKRTHNYNPSRSKNRFIITKLQWHPDPNSLILVSTDLQRKIAVFDFILNKVIAEAEEGGSTFCFTPKGTSIATINNMEIRVYESTTLKPLYSVPLQQYMQAIHIIGNRLFFGGQETGLFSINLDKPQQIKQHKKCTDNGVMKIMSYGHEKTKKLMVLSIQQNISVLKLNSQNEPIFEKLVVGYNDEIIDMKYSKVNQSDCDFFIMITNSNNFKIMNRHTHQLAYLVEGHSNTVLCCDYMHPFIATGGKDNIMKLWKIDEEKKKIALVANYEGHSADILSISFFKSKKIIATVSDDKTLKLWPFCEDSSQVISIKSSLHTTSAHAKSVNTVRISPKQDMIATCSQDRSIKIWTTDLMLMMVLTGHRRGVWDVAFHQVENLLVSVAGDGMMKGWNLLTGECMWSMGEGASLMRCAWIYYNQVITGSLDGIVKIWDIRKQTSLSYDKHEGKIWSLDVMKSEGEKHEKYVQILSGGADSVYHVWRDNTKETREDIMHKHEVEQLEKAKYSQLMFDKKYCEAAIVAFRSGYSQLFTNVMEQMQFPFDGDCQVKFQEGMLMVDEKEEKSKASDQQFTDLINKLKEINFEKLLLHLQTMNSTVRHYKLANKIIKEILRSTPITDLVKLKNSFYMESEHKEQIHQFNEKKTDFEKWLKSMISSEERHILRVQKYLKGTYWIDHLYKRDNPLSG